MSQLFQDWSQAQGSANCHWVSAFSAILRTHWSVGREVGNAGLFLFVNFLRSIFYPYNLSLLFCVQMSHFSLFLARYHLCSAAVELDLFFDECSPVDVLSLCYVSDRGLCFTSITLETYLLSITKCSLYFNWRATDLWHISFSEISPKSGTKSSGCEQKVSLN